MPRLTPFILLCALCASAFIGRAARSAISLRLIVILALLGPGSLRETQSASKPPNIVVFLSDDLGRLDVSIHGSPDARTPTMDRLSQSGMTFDNAYVASPSCCPNRFSLQTGLMPARHGAHPNHSQVKPGTKFLAPILKDMGYHIATFGKVAHGTGKFVDADYQHKERETMHEHAIPYVNELDHDGPLALFVGDRRPHVAWIEQAHDYYKPEELTLPPTFIDTRETREHWARYLTDITNMDAEMGRIYDYAKEKFGDNFIFLFTSDHGGQWPFGKWNLYDYGARIPMIVVWPGHIEPGTRTGAFTSWVDIIPTLIDLAGGKIDHDIDGRSFAPVLLGESDTHRDKIFTTHTGDGVMNRFPVRSVRVGKYKYIHNLRPDAYHTNHSDRDRKDGAGAFWDSWDAAAKEDRKAAAILRAYYTRSEYELFDLEKDPLERKNLASNPEYAEKLAELKATLAEWTTAQGDELLPHAEPYPVSEPLPVIKRKPKGKGKGKKK